MSLKSASAAARHPNPGLTELLLQAMTLLATGIPARRVSRIDPMASLRWERNPCDSPLSSDPGNVPEDLKSKTGKDNAGSRRLRENAGGTPSPGV